MHRAIKSVRFEPAKVEHSDKIYWPNGEGFTPCSREYAEKMDAKDAIFDPNIDMERGRTLEDLSPEDYQRYCQLDHGLMALQADGHLGKSVRY